MALTFAALLDAVPLVPTTAYRNAFYRSTTPLNQRVQNLETGNIERWNGSAWVTDFYGAGGSSATGAIVLTGSSSPAGAVVGNPGWLYVQQVSATVTVLWEKQSGTATTTGWIATQATGTGSPEGVVTAPPGTTYSQQDGASGAVLWVKNSGTGNTGWRPFQTSLGVFNVKDFGAKGDGTTDDTTAIQAAITAVPAGGTLWFPAATYKITVALSVPNGITILGYGATLNQTVTNVGGLSCSASQTRIAGLTITGPDNAASGQKTSGRGIQVVGADSSNYLTDVRIEDCAISGFTPYGVLLQYVQQFQVVNNRISQIGYAGIMALSCSQGAIRGNLVDTIGSSASANSYGISLNRLTTVSLAADPVCSDIAVVGNVVRNVVAWEGLDTHGGHRITFSGNTVYGCHSGIAVVGSKDSSGNDTYPPVDCAVGGNVVDSGVTDGSASTGISFAGAADSGDPATGTVTGNVVRGHGDATNSTSSGGIYVRTTAALVVSGNAVIECSPFGINVYTANAGCTVTGNTVQDVWSNTVTIPTAVMVPSVSNKALIAGNRLIAGSKSATYLNVYGSRISNATDNRIAYGYNEFTDAVTNPYNNVGAAVVIGPGSTLNTSAGDADYSFTVGGSPEVVAFTTVLTANRTVTLSTTGAYTGARARFIRSGLGAFTLAIGSAYTIPASTAATVDVVFRAGAWQLAGVVLQAAPAPLASPAFTGTPSLPTGTTGVTQTANDNSTKMATTAYVDRAPGSGSATSAAPAGTTSTTAVMMATGGTLTPARSTRALLIISGQMANATVNDGATVQLRYGTGTAPTNGAAVTGTQAGASQTATSLVAAQRSGFSIAAVVTGLTIGTAYWVDVALNAVTGGTATVTGVSIALSEI